MYQEEKTVPIQLTDHEQYLALLDQLEVRTAAIILVQIDGGGTADEIVSQASSCMKLLEKKKVSRWPGTVTKGKPAIQYIYQADGRFFKFLKRFPSFFFNRRDSWGCDLVEETEFGQDDIAFLDSSRSLLFFTTTHEGYAYILPSLKCPGIE